jgi:hypothetical protein
MIPPADAPLSDHDLHRWRFTELAAALVREGVPAETVLSDARQGCLLAARLAWRDGDAGSGGSAGRGATGAGAATVDRPGTHRRDEGET